MGMKEKLSNRNGQMTVELAIAFPVLIIIAVIAVNALLLFSECASFDNSFRDAVRVYATAPAYGQELEQSKAQVATALAKSSDKPYLASSVAVQGNSGGHVTFEGTLDFSPTLFGLGLKSSVFGVSLPHLLHKVSLTVDCYKPGVLL